MEYITDYVSSLPNIFDFNIDNYIDSLPDNIELLKIDLSCISYKSYKNIIIPNLSRFKKLKKLICRSNNFFSPKVGIKIIALTNLPENLKILDVKNNYLTYLPTLPTSLEYLICSHNCLTILPELPSKLHNLQCDYNYLAILPNLPLYLEILNCNHNELNVIPELHNKLTSLLCSNNYLNILPEFPSTLNWLKCNNNPYIYGGNINIYYKDKHCCDFRGYIGDKNIIIDINEEFQKIRKWRFIFYHLKYKRKFIQWYYRSQEEKIRKKYHPSKINELLDKNIEIEDLDLYI
jgi:hypothetical protein